MPSLSALLFMGVWALNILFVKNYLIKNNKAFHAVTGDCLQCGDARIGGGDLFGGAACMSFGLPMFLIFWFTRWEVFLMIFIIQAIYSVVMFGTNVYPKIRRYKSVKIKSHAGGDLSLCGMVAAMNIGPFYWISQFFPKTRPYVASIVDFITEVNHVIASLIFLLSFGKVTTGWSEKV